MYDFVEHGWGLTWSIVYSSVLTSEKETWNSWSESSKAQLKWLWNWSISPVKKCWRNWDYSVWKRESSGHKEDGPDSSLWAQRKFWLNVMKSSLLWGWLRWKGLLRESVESTSLEIFKSCLDTGLHNVPQGTCLSRDQMVSRCLFLPQPFWYSANHEAKSHLWLQQPLIWPGVQWTEKIWSQK